MPPLKLIAILFFVASIILGGIALKNAYGSYTERTNTDVSRASHVITKAGGYEYIYTVGPEARYQPKSRRVELHFVLCGGVWGGRDTLGAYGDSDRLTAARAG